ncbi:hypothetical protein SR882_02135 [Guyparkeria halophila]|uniref:Uncharacterized protein n=1 Tax=Guyparkeria halophila TaxID=47960 RepID=A0ABZ0YX23_9GAMM|nr:hypothetical protein [Guyparkeria halophila]WQH16722.1 hypothetical protein SR882_02135 [Guyparkeria halophila]
MNRLTRITLSVLVGIGTVFFLLPTTVVYVFGYLFLLGPAWASHPEPATLVFSIVCLLPGYGLYSVWWLVLKNRSASFYQIPKYVWVGLAVGCLIAVLFYFPFMLSNSDTSYRDQLAQTLLFGGGVFLVAVTTLTAMWLERHEGE